MSTITAAQERAHEEDVLDLGYEMCFEEIEKAQKRGTHTLLGAHNVVLHREFERQAALFQALARMSI